MFFDHVAPLSIHNFRNNKNAGMVGSAADDNPARENLGKHHTPVGNP